MSFDSHDPQILISFFTYLNAVRNLSSSTIQEYYLDLRTFFRFLKCKRGIADPSAPFEEIEISVGLLEQARSNPDIEILSDPYEMNFDENGNLF